MAFKFVAFATLLAVARAGLLPAAAPLAAIPAARIAYPAPIARLAAAPVAFAAAPVAKAVVSAPLAEEYDANPQYSYGYDVQDALTGDSKSQFETRSGDVVQGSYSVSDPDGTRRTVDYTADPLNGFNAVVRKEPLTAAVVQAAPVATVGHAAPLTIARAAHASPVVAVAHSAPFVANAAPLAYSAPIAKVAAPLAYSSAFLH